MGLLDTPGTSLEPAAEEALLPLSSLHCRRLNDSVLSCDALHGTPPLTQLLRVLMWPPRSPRRYSSIFSPRLISFTHTSSFSSRGARSHFHGSPPSTFPSVWFAFQRVTFSLRFHPLRPAFCHFFRPLLLFNAKASHLNVESARGWRSCQRRERT